MDWPDSGYSQPGTDETAWVGECSPTHSVSQRNLCLLRFCTRYSRIVDLGLCRYAGRGRKTNKRLSVFAE